MNKYKQRGEVREGADSILERDVAETRFSIIVPTYNERGNIEILYNSISKNLNGHDFEILIVDDNSPDGTSDIVADIQRKDPRVRLIKREKKNGLASAIMEGVKNANGEYVVMMDADLSHDPKDLVRMMDAINGGLDIVVGSRYMDGGRIIGWPLKRHIVSSGALILAKVLFNLPVKDTLSGFAIYKKKVLEQLNGKLSLLGYKLLLEVLVKTPEDVEVKEVPITFTNRLNGDSKLGFDQIYHYLKLCYRLKRYN